MKKVERYIYIVIIVILVGILSAGAPYIIMKNNGKNEIKENNNNQSNEENNKEEKIENEIINLSSFFTKLKHTFKKNGTGYYRYSTEVID